MDPRQWLICMQFDAEFECMKRHSSVPSFVTEHWIFFSLSDQVDLYKMPIEKIARKSASIKMKACCYTHTHTRLIGWRRWRELQSATIDIRQFERFVSDSERNDFVNGTKQCNVACWMREIKGECCGGGGGVVSRCTNCTAFTIFFAHESQ